MARSRFSRRAASFILASLAVVSFQCWRWFDTSLSLAFSSASLQVPPGTAGVAVPAIVGRGNAGTSHVMVAGGRATSRKVLHIQARAVGLLWSRDGKPTEEAAEAVGKISAATGLIAQELDEIDVEDLEAYDGLIIGVPDVPMATAWLNFLDFVQVLGVKDKPVALYSIGNPNRERFCDGMKPLHMKFSACEAKIVGRVSVEGYKFVGNSNSLKDKKFYGLALDHVNDDERITKWVEQIKGEGMPL